MVNKCWMGIIEIFRNSHNGYTYDDLILLPGQITFGTS